MQKQKFSETSMRESAKRNEVKMKEDCHSLYKIHPAHIAYITLCPLSQSKPFNQILKL